MQEVSQLELLKGRFKQEPAALDGFVASLSKDELLDLTYNIEFVGRPKQQLPPGAWSTWLILAGRGFGKTFVGAHTVNNWAKHHPRIALIGETVADVRDVMVKGESGILAQSDPRFMPVYEPSKRLLTWPNGAIAQTFSGEEPDQLRGPQFHKAWVDELPKFLYQDEVWDMLQFCMRLGDLPQIVVTTTPRPTQLVKTLVKDPSTVVTIGSTFENSANLAQPFISTLKKKYEGTRLGQQELYAAILDDNPGALFKAIDIQAGRVSRVSEDDILWLEQMDRIVVAVDPSTTSNDGSDECGLIVAGRKGDHGYVFADHSAILTPNQWGDEALKMYAAYKADLVVGEANNGGDMIETLLKNKDRFVNYKKVHATRGKAIRAEPIASLYEQHRIHHVGYFEKLEEQMCGFDPSLGRHQKSPDRMDALVWALTELFDNELGEPRAYFL